jgi:hypothetical protein
MTVTHLVFALATTAYILVAIQLEERDLLREHGKAYAEYRQSVPMLLPIGSSQRPSRTGESVGVGAASGNAD